MSQFNVYYIGPDGSSNHTILEANYCNEAAEYVESVKGGRVWHVECTDFEAFRAWALKDMEIDDGSEESDEAGSPTAPIRKMILGR